FVPPEDLKRNGILKFAVPEGPPHMDPHLTVSSGLLTWGAGQSYSRLFKFDTSGDGSVIVCDLCVSWEQTAPVTFVIRLRDDVRWQNLPPLNGRLLTARDVVFSLKRQATPNFPNAALLSNVADFVAVGDDEVIVRLKVPDSETLEKLADSHSRIVAPEAVAVNGDLRRGPTVGTGAWITSEAQSDQIALLGNPDYYNNQLPYLDGLQIQVIPSESTRVAGMRTRIIDLAQARFPAITSATERFENIEWTGINNPAAGVEIALNTARSPMDKLVVREAMLLVWDPEAWNEEFWHGRTGMSVGLPDRPSPGPGIDRNLPASEFFGRVNDTIEANSLLALAGLTTSDSVVIQVGEFGDEYVEQAFAMAGGLASAGIRAEVSRLSTRNFGDEVWIGGDYDIAVGAPPPVSSTSDYLFSVHHSEGPWNTTGYTDPEIDRLIEAQAREYDPVKRGKLLIDLQRRILAGSHRFISATRTTYWMWWDYVHDFNPRTPRGDSDFLTRVWLTERGD
ncbi:MAG: ABC transporter substrate-binding protein, partial [Dehalococcoidia bacterium]|nr:ABC transporter substrate-binding protein [Dehalococcoidia bacterium]